MRHLPNIITKFRIAGSMGLMFRNVTGWMFWTLYVLCGISLLPLICRSMVPAAIAAIVATFAAIQEGHFIRHQKENMQPTLPLHEFTILYITLAQASSIFAENIKIQKIWDS